MLTDADKQDIEDIITRRVDRVENKIDKILKIVTRNDQEHTVTKVKVDKHDKRLRKVEKILKIPSPSESVIFS